MRAGRRLRMELHREADEATVADDEPARQAHAARHALGLARDRHEEAVERMRLGVFGGMPEEPLKHLGEAQTCYLIRHLSEFEGSWWVTEDGDAYDFGVRSGMQTLRTFEVMQHMVADGDLAADAALALMRAMEEAGRALLHMPQRPSSFC